METNGTVCAAPNCWAPEQLASRKNVPGTCVQQPVVQKVSGWCPEIVRKVPTIGKQKKCAWNFVPKPGYKDQGIRGYKDQGIRGYKDQGIRGYNDQGIRGYNDQGIRVYKDQGIRGYKVQGYCGFPSPLGTPP